MEEATKSPRPVPQPVRFRRKSKPYPITANLDNTSQSQSNNAPITGSRLIEGVGNSTMVEGDFSGVNLSQFPSVSMTQDSMINDCERCRKLEVMLNRENG